MKKFIVLSTVLLMLAGFSITSSAVDVTLYADQIIDVGTLTVEVVSTDLVVTYAITAPWVLGETHLYVGTAKPTKSAPGRFPYGPEDAAGGVYTIPLTDFGEVFPLYIAAQAEVTNPEEIDPVTELPPREETAWAYGDQIRHGKNWAMFFVCAHSIYEFQYDVPDGIVAGEEYIVDVTFCSIEVSELGYGGVRFKFSAIGPGDVTFTATDSSGTHEQTNEGFWGPSDGFDIPADYSATVPWTFTFSEPGEYTITFSLIEALDGDVVDGITGVEVVTVLP
jgi:hypothetical protein